MRIGSMFSGAGGLDMAVREVFCGCCCPTCRRGGGHCAGNYCHPKKAKELRNDDMDHRCV